jgi:glycosyltransferase involved in cell wall biosynthesis
VADHWIVAVVSPTVPPQVTGQSVVLGRLLAGIAPRAQILVTSHLLAPQKTPAGVEIVRLRRVFRIGRFDERHLLADALPAALQIAWLVRKRGIRALVGCTGGPELIAAWLAGRLTGVPFHAYVFDPFRHQFRRYPRLMAVLESRIVRGARSILVPGAALADTLRQKYGVDPVVIHQPADDRPIDEPPQAPGANDELRIVYTGNVYEAQADSMQRIADVLGSRPDGLERVHLHVYAPQTLGAMRLIGFTPPSDRVTVHTPVPPPEVSRCQRQAHVLFLPLAFDSPYPELIRTAIPGKTAEYLASGVPILVHAPENSCLATYFRAHGCGVVVGTPTVAELAVALKAVVTDGALREDVVSRAQERARVDFDPELARAKLRSALEAPDSAACRAGLPIGIP